MRESTELLERIKGGRRWAFDVTFIKKCIGEYKLPSDEYFVSIHIIKGIKTFVLFTNRTRMFIYYRDVTSSLATNSVSCIFEEPKLFENCFPPHTNSYLLYYLRTMRVVDGKLKTELKAESIPPLDMDNCGFNESVNTLMKIYSYMPEMYKYVRYLRERLKIEPYENRMPVRDEKLYDHISSNIECIGLKGAMDILYPDEYYINLEEFINYDKYGKTAIMLITNLSRIVIYYKTYFTDKDDMQNSLRCEKPSELVYEEPLSEDSCVFTMSTIRKLYLRGSGRSAELDPRIVPAEVIKILDGYEVSEIFIALWECKNMYNDRT